MATQNSSGRFGGYDDSTRPASRTEPGISRSSRPTASRASSTLPTGARTTTTRGTSASYAGRTSYSSSYAGRSAAGGSRTTATRSTASRSSGIRSASRPSGSRPSSSGTRRPAARRKAQGRFYAFAGIALALILILVFAVIRPFGRGKKPTPSPAQNIAQNVAQQPSGDSGASSGEDLQLSDSQQSQFEAMSALLNEGDTGEESGTLSADQLAQVADLRVNTSLPEEWLNILLLGTDERSLNDGARTDAMIICSINRTTGEVKLSSIMRDLAVDLNDIGQYSGTKRINAANYFGGPRLAIRTVNECFGLNIQSYVMVNFFGFTRIAERLGGVDVDVTQAEMEEINYRIYEQYKFARWEGIDESDIENEWLETYGANTHLDGRQTLAYARLRHFDGGDSVRTERQRTVLNKLLQKAKQLQPLQIVALATEMYGQVRTNLTIEEMMPIVNAVLNNGIANCKNMRLPVVGTYKQERRNEEDMLYDCDWNANHIQLYNFIYE